MVWYDVFCIMVPILSSTEHKLFYFWDPAMPHNNFSARNTIFFNFASPCAYLTLIGFFCSWTNRLDLSWTGPLLGLSWTSSSVLLFILGMSLRAFGGETLYLTQGTTVIFRKMLENVVKLFSTFWGGCSENNVDTWWQQLNLFLVRSWQWCLEWPGEMCGVQHRTSRTKHRLR